MFEELKQQVCQANLELVKHKLVVYTFGNVSGIDRKMRVMAIKPSGVNYEELTADKIVILDLDGRVIDSSLKPSSDTPTHLELYKKFETIGGICHTHSIYATMWAQAHRPIPCFGTTHADHFYGAVPVTDVMSDELIKNDYEINAGKLIVERFSQIDPMQIPAVLIAGHGPFTWGKDAGDAIHNAVMLEQCARTAIGTMSINPKQKPISKTLLDKHFLRKHGKNAYYGQK